MILYRISKLRFSVFDQFTFVMRKLFPLCLTLFVTATFAAEKPNIVFILADDLGWSELGSYGQTKIRTPRLDELAEQGMKFSRAYSGNAVCAPSRCVLLTGKHPGHAEVRNNRAMTRFGEKEGQHPIPAEEVTIAELLAKDGYKSGIFGKWGLGNMTSTGNPLKQGFDRFFGYNCQGVAHSYYPESLWSDDKIFPLENDPPVPGHGTLEKGADPNDPESYAMYKGSDYASDRINEQVLEFVKKNKDEPFFLYYPTIIPHLALHVPDEELEPYLKLGWNDPPFTRPKGGYTPHITPRAAYAAMITRMDRYIGNVLDLLKELKLDDNTIVVFTSDNGATYLDDVDYAFFESVKPLRGLKGSLYEGGIRVPQIVRWPGKVEPGSESDFVTGFEDWLPTLHEIAGSKSRIPDTVDGLSIVPTLLGKGQPQREFLYREFGAYGGQQSVLLGEKWKGIRQNILNKKSKAPLKIELYDLENDISETKDVSADHPEVVKQIEKLMKSERFPSETFKIGPLDKL